jgi:hypothetical protein
VHALGLEQLSASAQGDAKVKQCVAEQFSIGPRSACEQAIRFDEQRARDTLIAQIKVHATESRQERTQDLGFTG